VHIATSLVEQEHTRRLELWIAALIDEMKGFGKIIKEKEDIIFKLRNQKKEDDIKTKYILWCKAMALQRLTTDPDALFLFFIQRIANMAGARKGYNDQLQQNGAIAVISTLCEVRMPQRMKCSLCL